MSNSPKTDINDIRIREIAALTSANFITLGIVEPIVLRVMRSFDKENIFTARFIRGALLSQNIEIPIERIEVCIASMEEQAIVYRPDPTYMGYRISDDMEKLITAFCQRNF